jgi:hypothetical protein
VTGSATRSILAAAGNVLPLAGPHN